MFGSIVVSEACSAVVLQVVGFSVEVYDRCTRCSKNVVDIEIDQIYLYFFKSNDLVSTFSESCNNVLITAKVSMLTVVFNPRKMLYK